MLATCTEQADTATGPSGISPPDGSGLIAGETGDPNRLLTAKEAAAVLNVKPGTLAYWRREKVVGPKFIQLGPDGRSVRYKYSDLTDYLNARRSGPIDTDALLGK